MLHPKHASFGIRGLVGVAAVAFVLTGCKPGDQPSPPVAAAPATAPASDVAATTDLAPTKAPAAGEQSGSADASSGIGARDVAADLGAERVALSDFASGSDKSGDEDGTAGTGVVVVPARLDLGQIATNDSGVGVVKLVNQGTEPRTLRDCKTSCGCTTANCTKGKVLEPGDEMEVEIKLNGGPSPRKLDKVVTFVVSDQAPIKLDVHGESISFVALEPEALDPEKDPEGKLTLRSIDDQVFSIRSMYPPVAEGLPTEKASEHVIALDWDRWRELGSQRKLLFTLDHPKNEKVYGRVNVTRPNAVALGDTSAAPLSTKISLDAMLKQGKSGEAVAMIQAGDIDPAVMGGNRQLPLGTAARYGDILVIEALLDASADIDAVDRVGKTALMWAAQSKNVEAVRVLLDAGSDIEITDNIGNTALSWAAGFGNAATVSELIESGSAIEVTGAITGFTPLIWAAGFGEAGAVQALIDAGANVGVADGVQGATPMMHAARTGRLDNVKVLIAAGADLEDRDATGKTVFLMAAANSGAGPEMLQTLVDAGADVNAKDNIGNGALELADKRTDVRAASVVEMLKGILGEGAGG